MKTQLSTSNRRWARDSEALTGKGVHREWFEEKQIGGQSGELQ